jgi:TonB family protein
MKMYAAAAALALTVACASTPAKTKSVTVPLPAPGRPVAELQSALGSASADERRAAAWALAGAGKVPAGVRDALAGLRDGDEDPQVRLAAVWAIGHLPGAGAEDVYDTPPKLVHQTRPTYPPDAYNKKIRGMVLIEFLIDEQGNVAHAEVRESIPALDASALQTVRQWRFEPAMKGDHAVPSTAAAPVTFKFY